MHTSLDVFRRWFASALHAVDASHATSASLFALLPKTIFLHPNHTWTVGSVLRLNQNHERRLHNLKKYARTSSLKAKDSFSNFALRDNVLEVVMELL